MITIRRAHDNEIDVLREWLLGGEDYADLSPQISLGAEEPAGDDAPQGWWVGFAGTERRAKFAGTLFVDQAGEGLLAIHGPQLVSRARPEGRRQLVKFVVDRASAAGHKLLLEALVGCDDTEMGDVFSALQFQSQTTVDFLMSLLPQIPLHDHPQELSFRAVTADAVGQWRAVVAQTYTGSRDFPELQGLGDVHASFGPHLDSPTPEGVSRPRAWLVLEHDNLVGCLDCEIDAASRDAHLGYFGVIPAARGCRYGLAILRFVQSAARRAGCERVFAECDARNHPALAVYDAAGFLQYDARELWLRRVP